MNYHIPVMLKESINGLNIKPDGIYVDLTFGGGGHSKFILQKLSSNGHLFAFDVDKDVIKNVKHLLNLLLSGLYFDTHSYDFFYKRI